MRRRRRGQLGPQLLAVRGGLVPAVRLVAEARAHCGAQQGVRDARGQPRRAERSLCCALRAVSGNFYSGASGAGACDPCPANASSAACSDSRLRCRCDATFTGADSGACEACPANSFCSVGLTHPCCLHSSSPADSDSADDCVCLAGFFSHNATSPCFKCPANTYCQGGQTVNRCAFNSTSQIGSAIIEQCLCGPGTWRGCVDGRNADGDCAQRGRRLRQRLLDWSVGCFFCDAEDICVNSTLLQCLEHSSLQPGSDNCSDCACNGGTSKWPSTSTSKGRARETCAVYKMRFVENCKNCVSPRKGVSLREKRCVWHHTLPE